MIASFDKCNAVVFDFKAVKVMCQRQKIHTTRKLCKAHVCCGPIFIIYYSVWWLTAKYQLRFLHRKNTRLNYITIVIVKCLLLCCLD